MYPDSNFNSEPALREVTADELRPKEPKKEYWLREYPITIEFLSIGCVVKVGCKSIPFSSIDEAMKEVNAYVAHPKEMQERWRKILD